MATAEYHILTDIASNTWQESFELSAADLGAEFAGDWKICKRRLHGGLRDGVDVIEVDNGSLSYTIVPSRGMGLHQGSYNGQFIGWKSPADGPVNPLFINPGENGGLGWLKGFDEWVVRCGLNSNGAPCTDIVPDNNGNPSEVTLNLHGNIANLPAKYVAIRVTPGTPVKIEVIGIVEESQLFFPQLRLTTTIATLAGSNAVSVCDEVTNFKEVPAECELLYHCNYGAPFLDAGATLVAPSREVAPRDARAVEDIDTYTSYKGPTPGYVEQCYFHEMVADENGGTLAMLRNAAGNLGAVVRWNTKQMPGFTQWKNTCGAREGYVTGLEPGINYPNPKPFEREMGRVITLQPDETHVVDLTFEFCDSAAAVVAVEKEIATLLDGVETVVNQVPIPKWTQS